jgi:hypothetical protein
LEGLSDREAISALRRDIAWSLTAGGRSVGAPDEVPGQRHQLERPATKWLGRR